jgi:hypothetical protein
VTHGRTSIELPEWFVTKPSALRVRSCCALAGLVALVLLAATTLVGAREWRAWRPKVIADDIDRDDGSMSEVRMGPDLAVSWTIMGNGVQPAVPPRSYWEARVYKVSSGALIGTLADPEKQRYDDVAVSPSGGWIATESVASDQKTFTLRVWRTVERSLAWSRALPGSDSWISNVQFAPTGDRIFVRAGDGVSYWSLDGSKLGTFEEVQARFRRWVRLDRIRRPRFESRCQIALRLSHEEITDWKPEGP